MRSRWHVTCMLAFPFLAMRVCTASATQYSSIQARLPLSAICMRCVLSLSWLVRCGKSKTCSLIAQAGPVMLAFLLLVATAHTQPTTQGHNHTHHTQTTGRSTCKDAAEQRVALLVQYSNASGNRHTSNNAIPSKNKKTFEPPHIALLLFAFLVSLNRRPRQNPFRRSPKQQQRLHAPFSMLSWKLFPHSTPSLPPST